MLTGFYAGAFALVLAVVALFRVRTERIAVAVFAVVCILVVLGIQPFFGAIAHLPGFRDTYNTRLSILYSARHRIAGRLGPGRPHADAARQGRKAVALCGFAVALLLFPVLLVVATGATSARFFSRAFEVAWGFAPSPSGFQANSLPIVRLSALIIWVVFAGLAALLLYARARLGLRGTVFAALAVLLVVADLFRAGMGFNPAIPDSEAQQPTTPAIGYLQHEGLARFVGVEPTVGINPLPPDVGLRYGLYDARGYDFPVSGRFGEMWTRYVAPPTPLLPLDTTTVPYYNLVTEPATLRILSLLGVRNIMLEKGQPALHLTGVRLGYDGSDAVIYTNDNALPRTWLVSAQMVVADDEQALTTIGSAGFDPRRQVVTEQALPGLAKLGYAGGAGQRVHLDLQRTTRRDPRHRPKGVRARALRHVVPRLERNGRRPGRTDQPGRLHAPGRLGARRAPYRRVPVCARQLPLRSVAEPDRRLPLAAGRRLRRRAAPRDRQASGATSSPGRTRELWSSPAARPGPGGRPARRAPPDGARPGVPPLPAMSSGDVSRLCLRGPGPGAVAASRGAAEQAVGYCLTRRAAPVFRVGTASEVRLGDRHQWAGGLDVGPYPGVVLELGLPPDRQGKQPESLRGVVPLVVGRQTRRVREHDRRDAPPVQGLAYGADVPRGDGGSAVERQGHAVDHGLPRPFLAGPQKHAARAGTARHGELQLVDGLPGLGRLDEAEGGRVGEDHLAGGEVGPDLGKPLRQHDGHGGQGHVGRQGSSRRAPAPAPPPPGRRGRRRRSSRIRRRAAPPGSAGPEPR